MTTQDLDRKAFSFIARHRGRAPAVEFYESVGLEHTSSMTKRRLISQQGMDVVATNHGKMELLRLASSRTDIHA